MEELCRTWGCKEEDFKELKNWFHEQPHLPQDTPDDYLVQFLHSCYYDIAFAQRTINCYFNMISTSPEFFSHRTIADQAIQKVLNVCEMALLPGTTAEGYSMIFGQLTDSSASKFDYTPWLKYLFMVMDLVMMERPGCPGFICVYNFNGFGLRHLFKLSISNVKKYFEYLQDSAPVRNKGLHIFNVNPITNSLFAVGKPFMTKETYNNVHFYSSSQFETLAKIIPDTSLPCNLGGKGPSTAELQEETNRKLLTHAEWFRFNETLRVTGSCKH